jgi:very-short-patch-repair endonuclease
MRGTPYEATVAARQMRNALTPAEQALWQAIRRRQVEGARFPRQHPLGPFILDFCCPEHRLVIKVDGPIHDNRIEYDTNRTLHLENYGYHASSASRTTRSCTISVRSSAALLRRSLA